MRNAVRAQKFPTVPANWAFFDASRFTNKAHDGAVTSRLPKPICPTIDEKVPPMPLIKSHHAVDNAQFKTLQRWVWICIYGGLLLLVLSHFLQPLDGMLADWSLWLGLPLVALGCVLIYVRSRMEGMEK